MLRASVDSIYTLRNKRDIAHKNEVDPNTVDLAFINQGAAWIMAELIRSASGSPMQEAGGLIELVQVPVGTLVEEIDGTRLVHANVSIRNEVLLLLHSHYPNRVAMADILNSMSARSSGSVRNQLGRLRSEKLLHGNANIGYRLLKQVMPLQCTRLADCRQRHDAAGLCRALEAAHIKPFAEGGSHDPTNGLLLR